MSGNNRFFTSDEPELVTCRCCGQDIPQDEGCPRCEGGDDPRFDRRCPCCGEWIPQVFYPGEHWREGQCPVCSER